MGDAGSFNIDACIESMKTFRKESAPSHAKEKNRHMVAKKRLDSIVETAPTVVDELFDTLAIYSKVAEEWQLKTLATCNNTPSENHSCVHPKSTCYAVDVSVTVYYTVSNSGMKKLEERHIKEAIAKYKPIPIPKKKDDAPVDGSRKRKRAEDAILKQTCWRCCRCPNNLIYRQYTSVASMCTDVREEHSDKIIHLPRTFTRGHTLLPCSTDANLSPRMHMPGLLKGVYVHGTVTGGMYSTDAEEQPQYVMVPFFISNKKDDIINSNESSMHILLPRVKSLFLLSQPSVSLTPDTFIECSISLTEDTDIHISENRRHKAMGKKTKRKCRKRNIPLSVVSPTSYSLFSSIQEMSGGQSAHGKQEEGNGGTSHTIYGVMPQKDWDAFLVRLNIKECDDGRLETDMGQSINLGREDVCHCDCCVAQKVKQGWNKSVQKHDGAYYRSTNIRKKPRRNPETSKPRSMFLKSATEDMQQSSSSKQKEVHDVSCCCNCDKHSVQDIKAPHIPTVSPPPKPIAAKSSPSVVPEEEEDDVHIAHVCVSEGNDKKLRVCFGGDVVTHSGILDTVMSKRKGLSPLQKFTLHDGYFCSDTGLLHICLPEKCTFASEKTGWNKESGANVVCPFSSRVLTSDLYVDPFWRLPGIVSSNTDSSITAEELCHGKASLANLGKPRNGKRDEKYWNNPKVSPGSRRDWSATIETVRQLLEDPLVDSDTLKRHLTENYLSESGGYAEYMAVAMTQVAMLFSSNRFDSDINEMRKVISLSTRNIFKLTNQTAKQHIGFFKDRIEKGFSHIFENHIIGHVDLMDTWTAMEKNQKEGEEVPDLSKILNGNASTALPVDLIYSVIKGQWHQSEDIRTLANNIMKPRFLEHSPRLDMRNTSEIMYDAICYKDGVPSEVSDACFSSPDVNSADFIAQMVKIPQLSKLAPSITPQHVMDLRTHYPNIYKSVVYPQNVYASSKDLLSMRILQLHDIKKKPRPVMLNLSGRVRAQFIEIYARQAIQLWCLIRRHTHLGKTKPWLFPFAYFVIAAMYIFRNGVILPGRVLASDHKEVILEKDLVLMEILPREGSAFMLGFRDPIMPIERNIYKAIIDSIMHHDVPPQLFDFTKAELDNQPNDLFVPLRKAGARVTPTST